MQFYQEALSDIYERHKTDENNGLDSNDVPELQARYGKNALRTEDKTPWYMILVRQFTGVLIYILLAAAIVSGLLGETIDMWVIISILALNGVFGFIQEYRAQASIESLKKMARSNALVIRDGKEQEVDAEDLVPGDIILLQTGDRIPADARIIEHSSLQCQEGALTGESVPVKKQAGRLEGTLQVGDQKNMVFSGTVVTKGHAKAVVVATGMKTQIGEIAHLIQESESELTPLQKNLDTLSQRLGKVTIGICFAIFGFIAIGSDLAFTLEALKEPFILAVSLAVAAIPEGLPIVVTIALAFGTQRMVKKNALIKQLSSVETLGSTTVICTDKTGTLTKNQMTVTNVYYDGNTHEVTGTGYAPDGTIDGELPRILSEICALNNDAHLRKEDQWKVAGDPTEGCLLTLARKAGENEHELQKAHPRLAEVPFDSARKRMSTVHQLGDITHLLTKGAPDVVLGLCNRILTQDGVREITDKDKDAILTQNEQYASDALRVLGFAYKHVEDKDEYSDEDEHDLVFVGLAGMIDPARPEARDAVAKCKQAGIRTIMITGDHQTTAQAIAQDLGITGRVVTGQELDEIDLEAQVDDIGVFARVDPEDKMRIVDALQHNGEIVAMTGDGVNDAPALKESNIGVAMGITGTDVAKESASMILTDDNFASIVNAVEEGRNIYTNIKKFVNYLLSCNLGEVLTLFFAIFLFTNGDGELVLPLTATMILYMNLLTDSLPALALGVDPGDKQAMRKPPRPPQEPIITNNLFANIVLIGLLVAAATLIMFNWSWTTTGSLAHAQTMALTTLVALEIVRLAMIRRQYNTPSFSNKWLVLAVIAVFCLQALVIYNEWMQTIFNTVALSALDWGLIAIMCAATYGAGIVLGRLVRWMTGQAE